MAPRKKHPSPKKPPQRKRRANTMLGPDHEASSSTVAAKKAPPSVDTAAIDVPATPASKTPRSRLNMTSHRSATLFLRLNGPKSPAKQRPKPVTDSTLALIQSSSPISSQLPETLDSMLPPELPDPWDSPQMLATEKRLRPTFAQRLAGRSHSQIERSESPCFYRSSQPNIVPIPHALLETPSDSQLDSEIDSQITYDDAENREERRRAQEASNASKSQRSRPQQKNQQKDQITTNTKPLPPLEESSYKLNVETF